MFDVVVCVELGHMGELCGLIGEFHLIGGVLCCWVVIVVLFRVM